MNRNSSIDSQKSVSNPDGPHAGSSKKRFVSRAKILLSMNRNSSIDSQKSVSNPDGPHAGVLRRGL